MGRLLVIDGTPLLYRGYYSKGTAQLRTKSGLMSGAFYGALRTFQALQNRFNGSHFLFSFGMGLSGREKIYSGYKPGSQLPDDDVKPDGFMSQLDDVRQFLQAMAIPVLRVPKVEADDLIAIAARTWAGLDDAFHVVVVSSDRDFVQLINDKIMLYDDKAKLFFGPPEIEDTYKVPPERFLYYKALIGDIADCIPSVPGFGPVRAQKAVMAARVPFEVLPKTDPRYADYRRNLNLMRLPKTFDDLRAVLTGPEWRALSDALRRTFQHMYSGDYSGLWAAMDLSKAQQLLDKYECQSLKLIHFSKYCEPHVAKFNRGGF